MVVSDGMPEKEKKQQNVVRLFSRKYIQIHIVLLVWDNVHLLRH